MRNRRIPFYRALPGRAQWTKAVDRPRNLFFAPHCSICYQSAEMEQRMPKLVKLYIRHTLIGFAIAAAFVAMLFWFNVANLWHLVTHTDDGLLAAFLLFMFNGIVFSGVQFGIAIMRMAEPERDQTPRGGLPQHAAIPVPVDERIPARK